jgi:hypothetical protein
VTDRCVDAAQFIAPTGSWGDVGCATGPLLVQLALAAFARGYSVGRYSVAWAASEGPERAAVLIQSAGAAPETSEIPDETRPVGHQRQDRALLEELVAESTFLYQLSVLHRGRLELEPEHNGGALEALEGRLEANIDGASLDPDDVRRICAESDDGHGSVYVATRVLAAHAQIEPLVALLSNTDLEQPATFDAIHAALSHAAGPRAARAIEALVHASGALRALGLWWAGDSGVMPSVRWSQLAHPGPEVLGASLPWALGRLGSADDAHLLGPWLESPEPRLKQAAALAYLRLEPVAARRHLIQHRAHPSLLVTLCLFSEPSDALIELASASDDPARGCLALALAGTPAARNALLDGLGRPDAAAHAARALHLITGLEPLEAIERRVVLEDDILTASELERRSSGDSEVGVDRDQVTRFSVDRNAWESGIRARTTSSATSPQRLGEPLDATTSRRSLGNPRLAPSTRAWIAEELMIRFGVPLRVRSQPRVADYRHALAAFEA